MNQKPNSDVVKDILIEVQREQQISPFLDTSSLESYINEGIYFLNRITSVEIDYIEDLSARSLLKTYVLYANHKRLAEWKELFQSEYISLQEYYHINSDIS